MAEVVNQNPISGILTETIKAGKEAGGNFGSLFGSSGASNRIMNSAADLVELNVSAIKSQITQNEKQAEHQEKLDLIKLLPEEKRDTVVSALLAKYGITV